MKIIDHGTVVVLVPETDEDREWFKENVEGEPNWGDGYACDWRMAVDLVSLALAEGVAGNPHFAAAVARDRHFAAAVARDQQPKEDNMIEFHAVFIDETGCEFGATIRAKTHAEAWDKAREDYPESRCVQIESDKEAREREWRTYERISREIDNNW